MEFVSREMIRRSKNKSYGEQPKTKNVKLKLIENKMFNESFKDANMVNTSAIEIYSQAQLPRYRRGGSLLKSSSKSKHNN